IHLASIVLWTTLTSALIIHSDKDYYTYHSKATFGLQYGNQTFTYRGSPATPLDACSKIETSLNDTIAIIIRNETNKECHVAKQVSNVETSGARGVVVMNAPSYTFYDDLVTIEDSEADKFNITIPIVGITYSIGVQLLELIKKNASLSITISSDYEYAPMSFWQMVLTFISMMGLLCGSYYLLILISRASDFIKKHRRSNYVKQIKTHHFKAAKNVDPENRPMCSICLSEFEDGETVKTLRCGHSFHPECIDTWLVNERALCPVCRQGIYQVEDWNLLEENQSREIDLLLSEVEQRSVWTLDNIFRYVMCAAVVLSPFFLYM
ncbi:hypothetical protein WA538_003242, partial [Blastocystis sp. DL]